MAKAGERVRQVAISGAVAAEQPGDRRDETSAAFRDDWLRTGDVGCLDDEGYLYVLDRRDDLIISGGENVYPAEVEAVLLSHPGVADAGVYGIADERWGSVPAASVVARPGTSLTADDLIAFCRGRVAKYKVPVRIRFVNALPRTDSGKLQRRLLRDGASGVPSGGRQDVESSNGARSARVREGIPIITIRASEGSGPLGRLWPPALHR